MSHKDISKLAQFTRKETHGKDKPGDVFRWLGTQWVVEFSTTLWVWAKPAILSALEAE